MKRDKTRNSLNLLDSVMDGHGLWRKEEGWSLENNTTSATTVVGGSYIHNEFVGGGVWDDRI